MIPSMWADRIEDEQRLWKWFLALGIVLVLLGIDTAIPGVPVPGTAFQKRCQDRPPLS